MRRVIVLAVLAVAAAACTSGGQPQPHTTRSSAELIRIITTSSVREDRVAAATELAEALDAGAIARLFALAASDARAAEAIALVRDRLVLLYADRTSAADVTRRARIVTALSAIHDEAAARMLARILAEEPDDTVAQLAADGLRASEVLPEIADLLVEARSALSAGARAAAVEELIASTGTRGVDALLNALAQSDWVAGVLADIGREAVAPLADLIGSRDLATDLAAIKALRLIERRHPHAAGSVWPPLVKDMIEKLGGSGDEDSRSILIAIGGPAVPALFEIVGQNLAGASQRAHTRVESAGMIIDQMAREDGSPVPFLKKKLANRDYEFIRNHAVYFIHLGKPGSEDILIAALNQASNLVDAPALEFIESGHPPLVNAAHEWASQHGYSITGAPAGFLSWGDWGIYL